MSRSALSKNRVFSGHGTQRCQPKKTLWTSFPKRSSGLTRFALSFRLAECHLASAAAVTLQPPHLELRPLWLPARLGRGPLLSSSGSRRGEGANPSSHGMADDLGDTKDCWKQAFRHPQGVVGPAPLPTPVWAEARMGDSPGPEAGGQARASSGEAEAGWAGGDGVSAPEKHCARATVFLEHKPCSKAETFTCNRETFIL